jgi:hypothetical protein
LAATVLFFEVISSIRHVRKRHARDRHHLTWLHEKVEVILKAWDLDIFPLSDTKEETPYANGIMIKIQA